MEHQEYIIHKKELYDKLMQLIEYESIYDDDFAILINFIKNQKIQKNANELKLLIGLLIDISNNHHRKYNLIDRIEQILLYFEDDIKEKLSASEIFNLSKRNKLILLFLHNKNFIKIQSFLPDLDRMYYPFFYPEI